MKLTIIEEYRQGRVREERRKTLRLVGWIAFWILLFSLLHALT